MVRGEILLHVQEEPDPVVCDARFVARFFQRGKFIFHDHGNAALVRQRGGLGFGIGRRVMEPQFQQHVFRESFYRRDAAVVLVEAVLAWLVDFLQGIRESRQVAHQQVRDVNQQAFPFQVRFGFDFGRGQDAVRERPRGGSRRRRSTRRGKSRVLNNPLDVLADLAEGKRKTAAHLRRVKPSLAHRLVHCGGEEKRFIELFGEDFHQDSVLFRFAVESEQSFQGFHVFDHFIERLLVIAFGCFRFLFLLLGGFGPRF